MTTSSRVASASKHPQRIARGISDWDEMPKRAQETYEDDGGFVEDAPKSKKSKKADKSEGNSVKRAEGKTPVSTERQTDKDGNAYWEISRARRVQISEYRGAQMVNIREWYEKDGEMLPGKKGITLSIDQFIAVLDILPDMEAALKEKGIDVPRPNYDGVVKAESPAVKIQEDSADDVEDDDEDDDVTTAPVAKPVKSVSEKPKDEKRPKSKLETYKLNHEATGDEESC